MSLEAAWRLLHRRPLLALSVLLCLGAAGFLYYNARSARALVESKALLDAALFSRTIADVRTIYTSEVVEVVRSKGIAVAHDYKERGDGAIPLPVTFSMLLGRTVGEHQSGESSHLYSPHPFPWRGDGGLRDDFARAAWESLRREPDVPFHRFDTIADRRVLRYATADLMRSSCVACHNSHPDSPKRDWKVGDLRGVLEVRLPMYRIEEETRAGLRGSLLLLAVGGGIGLGLLGLVIGRLRRTTEDLLDARDRAVGAVRAQNEFLGNMSHELRTPLHAIIGYSEMLGEELQEAGQQRLLPDVRKIRDAGQSLRALIDNVLEAARLRSGTATLELETFDVAELVQEVGAPLAELPRSGPVIFVIDCPKEIGNMHADRRKLQRALAQVLSNARKFTERGRITLRVGRVSSGGQECLRFEVADTGIGIPPELHARLFEPFVQGDSSARRRHPGMGLGLAIVASTVRMMGGEITVTSAVGKGSTFTMLVPARMEGGPKTVSASGP